MMPTGRTRRSSQRCLSRRASYRSVQPPPGRVAHAADAPAFDRQAVRPHILTAQSIPHRPAPLPRTAHRLPATEASRHSHRAKPIKDRPSPCGLSSPSGFINFVAVGRFCSSAFRRRETDETLTLTAVLKLPSAIPSITCTPSVTAIPHPSWLA